MDWLVGEACGCVEGDLECGNDWLQLALDLGRLPDRNQPSTPDRPLTNCSVSSPPLGNKSCRFVAYLQDRVKLGFA